MKIRSILCACFCLCAVGVRAQLNTWISQNPPNLSGTYRAIQIVSAATTYIVGDNGNVTMTKDGGQTLAGISICPQNLYAVSFFDSLTGMVVGSAGAAFKTVDGGATWKPMTTGTSDQLFGVLMVDRSLAIACGGTTTNGTVRITRDSGRTWASYAGELSFGYVRSVRMLRPDFIVFVGNAGAFYVSRDSARTFVPYQIPVQNDINDVCFLDDLHAIAVGGPGRYMIGTSDGGTTWKILDTNDFSGNGSHTLNSVDGRTTSSVVTVGDHGEIMYSSDGGASWGHGYFGGLSSIKGVSMLSGSIGMAVGQDGTILRTTDGGANWDYVPRKPQTSTLRTIQMLPDGKTGFAAGSYGAIMATSDSGHLWISVPSGTDQTLYGSVLFESGNGFVVGEKGTILKTTDAGGSWAPVVSHTTKNLYCICAPTPNAIYAGGDSALFLRSTDGGQYWTQYRGPVPDSSGITAIAFTDSVRGFITSRNGIFRTTDAGISWRISTVPDTFAFSTVAFGASRTHAYIGGLGGLGPPPQQWHGALGYTTDFGDSWSFVDLTQFTTRAPQGIYTVDGYHATVVCRAGLILHSSDPSLPWFSQPTPTTQDLYAVAFGTTHAGWACGIRGTILRIDTDEEADVRTPLPASIASIRIGSVYPNPAVDRIHLLYSLDTPAPTTLEVRTLLGSLVASFDLGRQGGGEHTADLAVRDISSGTYVLMLRSANSTATSQIVITH